jgi:hypothetical protein
MRAAPGQRALDPGGAVAGEDGEAEAHDHCHARRHAETAVRQQVFVEPGIQQAVETE